jgi:hypothetical protein
VVGLGQSTWLSTKVAPWTVISRTVCPSLFTVEPPPRDRSSRAGRLGRLAHAAIPPRRGPRRTENHGVDERSMRGMFSGSRAGTKLEFVTSDLRYSNPWKFKGRFFQIPPDLVVKSQIIDIIGFIMPLMQEKTLVHTSPRPRRSRCEPLSRSEGCWFTTKSAGMWDIPHGRILTLYSHNVQKYCARERMTSNGTSAPSYKLREIERRREAPQQ